MNPAIVLIPTNDVRSAWGKVKGLLKPAIDRSSGRWTPEYVLASLVLGEQSLWVAVHNNRVLGAATSQISQYPEKKNVAIHFLGGTDWDDWYPKLLETISDYGKANGCESIECLARSGFWKWFKQDGFEKTSVFYEKKI